MKVTKRILAIMLAAVMCISLMPTFAGAIAKEPPTKPARYTGGKIDLDKASNLVFSDDFESYYPGNKPRGVANDMDQWSKITSNDEAKVYIAASENNPENQYLMFEVVPERGEKGGPAVQKYFNIFGHKPVIYVGFAHSKMGGKRLNIRISDAIGTRFTFNLAEQSFETGYVTVALDFEQMLCELYIDGKCVVSKAIPADWDFENNFTFSLQGTLQPGEKMAIDNVEFYSSITDFGKAPIPDVEKEFVGDTTILNSLRTGHPRLWFNEENSFADLKKRIDASEYLTAAYNNLKVGVDENHLVAKPFEKVVSTDRSPYLSWARSTENRLIGLAFIGAMTGDTKYKDRALEEMKSVFEAGNWINGSALAVSEMSTGVALAYDWLYNQMTAEERKFVEEGLLENALVDMAKSFAGKGGINNYVNDTGNNRGVVNDGSAIIAALAMYEVYPNCMSLILDGAGKKMPESMVCYEPEGAWYEGISYWNLTTRYAAFTTEAINTAVKPGYAIPRVLDFSNEPGFAQTAEYVMYSNGPVGAFNYGDASPEPLKTGPLYWLANQFDQPAYAAYQYNNFDVNTLPSGYLSNQLFLIMNMNVEDTDASQFADFPLGRLYSSDWCDIMVMRNSWLTNDATYLGIQGGQNGASHSVYSLGNFMLQANGETWVTMRPRYDYDWPGERYMYYQARPEGWNVIVFDPDESCGQDLTGRATSEKLETNANGTYGVMNLANAYSTKVTSYKRGVRIDNLTGAALVQDEVKGKKTFESGYWFAHTDAAIEIAEDGKSAILTQNGKQMLVRIAQGFEGAVLTKMEAKALESSPEPPIDVGRTYGHKLAIDISGQKDFTLAVEFIPLDKGETDAESPFAAEAIADWKLDTETQARPEIWNTVALFVDKANAYAGNELTQVDVNNPEIAPIVQNGRTLVPVRFIAEKFGAEVGWDDATQTVTVKNGNKTITLQIGSDKMQVGADTVTLDVPAQTIGGRTLIPLRAMVEAMDKAVFWDDRGLIVISDMKITFDAETVNYLVEMLNK